MRLVLFGPNGQVGWELQRALMPLGDVVALDRHAREPASGDLEQPDAIASAIRCLRPSVVVNAAAYTAVDKAESEPARAECINMTAVAAMAQACAEVKALLVHYSTDYVFDGSGESPRPESAPIAPLSVYGRTKADGEAAIRASGCDHLIFRTSWVYAARGNNFARTMLRLARERAALSVVSDQVGAPTGAELIADATVHAIRSVVSAGDRAALCGTYHLAARGETTWFDYAAHVIEAARARGEPLALAPGVLKAISTAQYPTPARRPLNSRLDVTRFEESFGLTLPDWRVGVDRVLQEWWSR
jgi:dTDP-4-dehydrorhamnose reductase